MGSEEIRKLPAQVSFLCQRHFDPQNCAAIGLNRI